MTHLCVRNVCIVGAGSSGLVSIKSCLENGMTPYCYEFASEIGGEWNREERIRLAIMPTMYKSLTTNISRANQGYSDFPYPKEWPPFLPWCRVMQYLNMYADQFDLRDFITFQTQVTRIFKSDSYDRTGSWMVESVNLLTNQQTIEEFDAVIAASGKLSKSVYPNIPGLSEYYKGTFIHSADYIGFEGYEDKSVLVIGASSSGTDVACDCAKVAGKVLLSARGGVWIMPRIFSDGVPLDQAVDSRFANNFSYWFSWFVSGRAERNFANVLRDRFNYKESGLCPKYYPFHPLTTRAINDELPVKLYTGRVLPRPAVKQITPSGTVLFENGQEEKVDIIIAATGYEASFPYLPAGVFPSEAEAKLFQWIFPYEMEHPSTLSIVGFYPHAGGPACTQVELQARYVSAVLSGKCQLPSKSQMEYRAKRSQKNMTVNGRFIFKGGSFQYQEELAYELGLIPSFTRLLLTDPRLAFKLYFGPFIPAHYRLIGEHRWDKAREQCLTENSLSGMKLLEKRNMM